MNPLFETCCHCDESFVRIAMRPYGPGGAWVCIVCALSPQHLAETEANAKAVASAALAVGGGQAHLTLGGFEPGPGSS